jgi:pre-mRNA-processing factor 40
MDIETLTRSQERSLWSIHKAESGQTYYYNLKSGSSQWDKPACFAEQGEEGQEVFLI